MSATLQQSTSYPVSAMAETLIGSEIIKLGNEVNERIKAGEKISNFTIGDFDPSIFPIPSLLLHEIINAYKEGYTNYPMANGMPELRAAVAEWSKDTYGLQYTPNEVLVAGGSRPVIYGIYATLIDAGDKVIFPVPSWNNNHYTHFVSGEHVVIEAGAETNFMPTAEAIRPYVKDAVLISLCSPQNPTGTTFRKEELEAICDLVIEENKTRGEGQKKLYVMFDQMYWHLTYGSIQHYNPVSLRPEMKEYTIFIDAISKVFAATGVRVGWSMGPATIINKMKAILTHIGAWAPMAEQKAVAYYLGNRAAIKKYLVHFKAEIEERLQRIYEGFSALKAEGFAVEAIAPEAAIYLTIKLDLVGKKTADGTVLAAQSDVTAYLLNKAGLAVVPFYAFGASKSSPWYRLSVGTCKKEEIGEMIGKLREALSGLKAP